MKIIEIKILKDWQKIKSEIKNKKEIILFKYSPACSVSFTAGRIFEKWVDNNKSHENYIAAKINVIESREVSSNVETETGIKHESPQIIWINSNGEVKWDESHFGITESNLNKQLTLT